MELSRPQGIARVFLRLPIALYRLHLGWLLGQRFLLLEHRGRKTGRLRYNVIEVIGRGRKKGAYYVAAAWAPRADWYQNIQRDRHVRIHGGSEHFSAVSRALSPGESRAYLQKYRQHHRLAAKALVRILGTTSDELLNTQVVEFSREPAHA